MNLIFKRTYLLCDFQIKLITEGVYILFRSAEMPPLTSRKLGGFKHKIGRFSKLHETSMVQNLLEIGRMPNLGVKMDKNVYKNRTPSSEIGRLGISGSVK